MKTIVLAGGGTAGHITPHLAILPELKNYFDKIYYIGSGKAIEKELINDEKVQIFDINPPAFIRSLSPKNLLIPKKLITATKECERFLTKVKADVVFSKGGYCALPPCFAAFRLKIPVICHESDLTPGLANKLCIRRSTAFLTTFLETAKKHNGKHVGPPIRTGFKHISKQKARALIGITDNRPVVLVTGGSQGSKTINLALNKNLDALLKDFNVIHLCGKGNKPLYSAINGYFAYEFADMSVMMSACDVAISRGGSNTLFELLSCKIPTAIIPLKKASRGDQIKNAEYFAKKGAILTMDEDLLERNLLLLTKQLFKNKNSLISNIEKLKIANGKDAIIKEIINATK